jgi:hypothetical protein
MAVENAAPAPAGFTSEQRERVLAEISKRLKGGRGCVLCGQAPLTLVDAPMYLSSQLPDRWFGSPDVRVLPCVALACDSCGYVHLFAMSRLGLGDLLPTLLSA